MNSSSLEREFETRMIQLGGDLPQWEREYKFHPRRRWRFDFAWPEHLVAVEIEGGIFNYGRHNRPLGYQNDCEKYNAATVRGWRVLRFTEGMLRDVPGMCIQAVRICLLESNNE